MPQGLLPVESVTRESYFDRVIEAYYLAGGIVVLELFWNGGIADYSSDRDFRRLFDGWEIEGTPLPKSLLPVRRAGITYAEFSHYVPCLAFIRPIGTRIPNIIGGLAAHQGTLYGYHCADMDYAYFVETMLGHLRHIDLRE